MPDSVLMHFDLITKGTQLEGVKLESSGRSGARSCAANAENRGRWMTIICFYVHFAIHVQVKPIAGDKVIIEEIKFRK